MRVDVFTDFMSLMIDKDVCSVDWFTQLGPHNPLICDVTESSYAYDLVG